MLLGARQFFERRGAPSGPTARDYVRDGLIAMWDGIENAGWGVHDATATTWKDLIGSANMSLASGTAYEWLPDSLRTQSCLWNTLTTGVVDLNQPFSIESVQEAVDVSSGQLLWSVNPQYNSGIWYAGIYFSYGYYKVLNNGYWNGGQTSLGVSHVGNDKMHISVVYNPGSSCDVYMNGKYLMSAENGNHEQTYITVSNFGVGGNARGGNLATDCLTRNVRIYSRALTAAEIEANYAIDKRRFNLP